MDKCILNCTVLKKYFVQAAIYITETSKALPKLLVLVSTIKLVFIKIPMKYLVLNKYYTYCLKSNNAKNKIFLIDELCFFISLKRYVL